MTLCGWRKQIDDYQDSLESALRSFSEANLDASVRGSGAGRFLFATSNSRSIELSEDLDEGSVYVEYWISTNQSSDHECDFHEYGAATTDAIQWLCGNCILDSCSSCVSCDCQITLRQWFDHATCSWPSKHLIGSECPHCKLTNHAALRHGAIHFGELDGGPAPNFIGIKQLKLDTMSFAWRDDGAAVYYQSLEWVIPKSAT